MTLLLMKAMKTRSLQLEEMGFSDYGISCTLSLFTLLQNIQEKYFVLNGAILTRDSLFLQVMIGVSKFGMPIVLKVYTHFSTTL